MTDITQKTVRTLDDKVQRYLDAWQMAADLMVGTKAMRAAGKQYMPKMSAEDSGSYNARLSVAVLHPAFKRSVSVYASKPFSRPVKFDDLLPEVEAILEDIDLKEVTAPAFLQKILQSLLAYGCTGVLTDCPPSQGARTKADEISLGIRPYMVEYSPLTWIGWRYDGKKLVQLRLLEMVEVPDGEYNVKTIEQVRVLTPGAWQTFRQDEKDKTVWKLFDEGQTSLDFIPFEFFTIFDDYTSPLLDIAYQNVEHWQSSSDQQSILHIARVPILFAKQFGPQDEIVIGAGTAIKVAGEAADLRYVEHSGAAIEAGRQAILDLEERMRQAGAQLMAKRVVKATATQVAGESEDSKNLLQYIVSRLEESFEKCLNWAAVWLNKTQACEVEIYKDFEISGDNDATTLLNAEKQGVISKQTVFEELQRRDVIDAERDWDEELIRMGEIDQGNEDIAGKKEDASELPQDEPDEEDDINIEDENE